MGYTAHYFSAPHYVQGSDTIKMSDIDLMTAIGFGMGTGALMGILWSLLLFYWRRETM